MVAITYTVLIELIPNSGNLTDISNRVTGLKITRPRAGIAEDQAPTTLELQVQNHPDASGFCPWSPDSPVSPYWPNVTRDRRILVTAFWPGGSSVRFFGWTDVWAPDAGERPPATATVTVSGSCILSRYARRRVLSIFGEVVLNPLAANAGMVDYWPFDDEPDSTMLRGWDGGAGTAQDGLVVQPSRLPGSMTVSQPDGGHITDGQLEFTRGDDLAPAPVVLIRTRAGTPMTAFNGWFKLSNDPLGVAGDDMIAGYNANAELLWTWSVRPISGKIRWCLLDRDGSPMSFYDTGAPRDEGWHYWMIRFLDPTNTAISTANKGETSMVSFGSYPWTYDPRNVAYIVLGGRMAPLRLGKQINTFQGGMSSLVLQYSPATVNYLLEGNPGVTRKSEQVTRLLNQTSSTVDAAMGGAVGGGNAVTDTTPLRYTNETRDLLARWNEIARTTGGQLLTRTYGAREYRNPVASRPVTPSVTLHAEQDLSAPDGGWQGVHDERPTRVTVTSPLGSFQVVDDATEMLTGQRLEGSSVATAAGSDGVARSVAGRILSSNTTPRMSSFGCDLTSTSTDKVGALMGMSPYDRMRITALPAALMGFTYIDVYASGWTETYDGDDQSTRWQFDSDPADDPPEGVFNDSEYGRFALGSSVISSGSMVGAGAVVLAADTFTGANGSAWSTVWTDAMGGISTGTRTIQANAGRLQTGTAGGYASTDRVAAAVASVTAADAVWRGRFRWPTGDECYARVYLRSAFPTLNGRSGYYIDFNRPGSAWEIGYSVEFNGTVLSAPASFSFTAGAWYWVEFGTVGSTIRGKFWLDGSTEPAFAATGATVTTATGGAGSFTDAALAGGGTIGFTLGGGGTAGALFDIDDVTVSTNFSDVTGSGGTGTGTVVLTGQVLTTNAGAYPLDLDWNGERVTVSGVAGGSSPQTATVTARGVAPTVARSHQGGEPVEIWHAMRFGA